MPRPVAGMNACRGKVWGWRPLSKEMKPVKGLGVHFRSMKNEGGAAAESIPPRADRIR